MTDEKTAPDELGRLEELLKNVPVFKETGEDNVFSLGARNYYENPTSDLLQFFLDPRASHGLSTLFLKSLMDCLPSVKFAPSFLRSIRYVKREFPTDNGKRMDILIDSEPQMLVLENKVTLSVVDNPVKDYERFIRCKYPRREEPIFVVLSVMPLQVPVGWQQVTFQKLFDALEPRLGKYVLNGCDLRWLVMLREFICNLREMSLDALNEKQLEFVVTHEDEIRRLIDLRDGVRDQLTKICSERLLANGWRDAKVQPYNGFDEEEMWRFNVSINLACYEPLGEALAWLYLAVTGEARILVVVDFHNDEVPRDKEQKVAHEIEGTHIHDYSDSSGTWHRYFVSPPGGFDSLEKALQVFGKSANILKQFLFPSSAKKGGAVEAV